VTAGPAKDRRSERIPVALEVEYRSAGAFLIAYSTNLSKGGLFLETEALQAVGTRMAIRLRAPDTSAIELEGVVAWVRGPEAARGGRVSGHGEVQPVGMGIELTTPEARYGTVVDQIVMRFSGIKILVGAGEPAPRAILHRYLRSILACEIIEADGAHQASPAAWQADLAVVDLDSLGPRADDLVRRVRTDPRSADIPVIALATQPRDRQRGADLGADELIPNPPVFADLQAAVIRTLARPSAVR